MKKVFRYVFLLLLTIAIVKLFVFLLTKPYYQDFNNYEISSEGPVISIEECKVDKNAVKIKGTAVNITNEIIKSSNIKFEFYNSKGLLTKTKYKKIEYFNVNELIEFDEKFECRDVSRIKISFVNE